MDLDNRNIRSAMSPIKAFTFESLRIKNEILKEEGAASQNDPASDDSAARKPLLDNSLEKNTMYLQNKYVDVSPTSSLQSAKLDSSTASHEDSFRPVKSVKFALRDEILCENCLKLLNLNKMRNLIAYSNQS